MTSGARSGRDRDAEGRARNARPRDPYGRPLPYGTRGIPRVPDDLTLAPGIALDEAQRLIDTGLPFNAHEVLEATWKTAAPGERDLWQGLAQLAVGLTHLQRRNTVGAATLLRRGAERIAAYSGNRPHGIDVDGLLRWARTLADRIGDPGDAQPPAPAELRPRLRG